MRLTRWLAVAACLLAIVTATAAQNPAPVYTPDDGVTVPGVTREVKPEYTKEAKSAGIQGTVTLDTVVLEDGTVGEVTVSRSLDSVYGLDEAAVKAMKQWRFEPGMKGGKRVRVRVSVEMTFTLK